MRSFCCILWIHLYLEVKKQTFRSVISGFPRDVNEVCTLLGYYAAESSNSISTFQNMRREEKPTRCHWIVYCTYNMLNMFRTRLCPSSGARDYMYIITAYGVQCFGCWLLVRCCAAGYVSRKRDVARLQSSNISHPAWCPAPDLQQPATKASHTIGGNNTHIVWSSWWGA